jgi:RNA polymerase sigma factor (sigma-70 family)
MHHVDTELLGIAAGDKVAFGRWMARAEPALRASLAGFAAAVDIEAVLQETLLRAWQIARRVEPDGRPEPLLRVAARIGHNLAISEWRRQRRVTSIPEKELEKALEEPVPAQPATPDPLLRRVIERCRERLPPQPRRALEARLLGAGGVPDRTLAERLGVRLNTFLQNVTRARRLLAKCLRSQGVDLGGESA